MKGLDLNRIFQFVLSVVLYFSISVRMGYGVTTFEYWTVVVLVTMLMSLSYRDGYDDGWKALGEKITGPLDKLKEKLEKMEGKEN